MGTVLPSMALANTAPPSVSLQLLSTPPNIPGQAVSFAANASGFTNPVYALSDSFSGSTVSSSDISNVGYFSWVPTVYDAGLHQITVTVSDAYSDAASSTIAIQVSSNAVLVQQLSPGSLSALGRPITFGIVAPGFINPSFNISDSYPGTNIYGADINSSGDFSWTPAVNQQGFHQLTIYASDAYGHSGSATLALTVTNPQVSISALKPSATAPAGTPITFTALATGLATTTTFSVSDSFSGTSTIANNITNAGAFNWTPTASDLGRHLLIVSASDGFGNVASTTQALTVTAAVPVAIPTPVAITTPATPTTVTPVAVVATPAPAPVTSSSGYVFAKLLTIGSRGTGVTKLQQRLTTLGFYSGPITAYYGTLTAAAVRRFQKAQGFAQVGYLGPLTRAALNRS